jgi:hypothetical protein
MLGNDGRFMFAIAMLLPMLLFCQTDNCKAASNEVWLDSMETSRAYSDYGRTRRNKSTADSSLQIASKRYEHGIGTRAPGQFCIDLDGKGLRFTAKVGIDDETNGKGSAVFELIGDDRVLWRSEIIRGGQPPVKADVDISSVKLLQLVVTTGDDSHDSDHADWVDAKFIMQGDNRPIAVSPPEFSILEKQIRHRKNGRNKELVLKVAKQTFNAQSLIHDADRDPVDVILRRTEALIKHLNKMADAPDLSDHLRRLNRFKSENATINVNDLTPRKKLFAEVAGLRREISFSNPLLNFDKILFIKRHINPGSEKKGNHMCDQYFGFHAIKGGGIFILDNAFSDNPTIRNVLENSLCENGRFKGRKLTSKGGFLSPELSFDGRTIFFAYTDIDPNGQRYVWNQDNTYHIFKVNVDGSHLRQLTDDATNDFDPCLLPNGRIMFISERRGGYGRCHGRAAPNYTLHSMNPDGTDIVILSPHETNEWHPSVGNDGMIVYTRWDYVDRGFNQAHHLWLTTPDGRDSRAIHGNFSPLERGRPHMELDGRAIPGSHKLIATAAAHHGQAYGSLVIIDPRVEDDDIMAPVRRITPDQLFPESESQAHRGPADYSSAWPLSEHFYLCVHDPQSRVYAGTANNYSIYLLDAFGNRERIYQDVEISCLNPIPLRPRKMPPVVPHTIAVGKPLAESEQFAQTESESIPDYGEVGLVNVYKTHYPFPEGTKIKALRIIQILPKSTPFASTPQIGYGDQKSARAVLGTVPVEDDGSAYFKLPSDKPVFFQALDADGLAVQSMRSATYVHPGEKLICRGCHDNRNRAPTRPKEYPIAMKRKPSEITPDVDGSKPFSFPRLVQPVLDSKCVSCHLKNADKKAPDLRRRDPAADPKVELTRELKRLNWYLSYYNLRPYVTFFGNAYYTTPRTIPEQFGANASKLYHMLRDGHHGVELSTEEMHRITLWLDSNADFFGSYENLEAQARGEIVLPTLE